MTPFSRSHHTRRLVQAIVGAGARRLIRRSVEDDRKLGYALAAELDGMKGMAMKVGQILSYLDGLPEEAQKVLARLQTGLTPRPYSQIERVIEGSLGAPVDKLFSHFDPQPVAAASIGQVHRAQYEGRPVAVKVQYPDVAQSFESDTGTLRKIASIASLAASVDGQALVDELSSRLAEECDYQREAQHQQLFRRAFLEPEGQEQRVIIPEVIPERSSLVVLTTTWQEGQGFRDFCEHGSSEEKNAAARTLARVAWQSLLVHHAINADPHPGNTLFQQDAVVCLDFGCTRHFDREFIQRLKALYQCVLNSDRNAFPSALQELGLVPRPQKYDFDAHWRQARYELEPYLKPGFHFTRSYTAQAAQFSRPTNPNLRRMALPPHFIWLIRLQYGLHAVLARLDAQADFATLFRAALEAPEAPL